MIKQFQQSELKEITSTFANQGLLIRTLQSKHFVSEFSNYNKTKDQLLKQNNGHSGLLKWTFTCKDLVTNYYKMSKGVGAIPRYIAVLVDPSKIKCYFVEDGFHLKDNFSGNLKPNSKLIDWKEAKEKIEKMHKELKDLQKDGKTAENNEIQTASINSDAIVGLMYWEDFDSLNKIKEKWNSQRKSEFTELIKKIKKSFPVFTYFIEKNQINLEYLDYLGS